MEFKQLLRATVKDEIIYFDGDGVLYEKHPARSHYTPTGKFVYFEYYNKPLLMLTPCVACLGAQEYDIEYTVDDAAALKQGATKNERLNKTT